VSELAQTGPAARAEPAGRVLKTFPGFHLKNVRLFTNKNTGELARDRARKNKAPRDQITANKVKIKAGGLERARVQERTGKIMAGLGDRNENKALFSKVPPNYKRR
jgi:hypothetical protein